jgi:hypothetical protein
VRITSRNRHFRTAQRRWSGPTLWKAASGARPQGVPTLGDFVAARDPGINSAAFDAAYSQRAPNELCADDFANGIIAKRLIELAKAGEHNPDLLCQGAIEQLRGHLYGD